MKKVYVNVCILWRGENLSNMTSNPSNPEAIIEEFDYTEIKYFCMVKSRQKTSP